MSVQNLQEEKERKLECLPPEPSPDDPESVKIIFKLPNDSRVERRFHFSQSLTVRTTWVVWCVYRVWPVDLEAFKESLESHWCICCFDELERKGSMERRVQRTFIDAFSYGYQLSSSKVFFHHIWALLRKKWFLAKKSHKTCLFEKGGSAMLLGLHWFQNLSGTYCSVEKDLSPPT